MSELPQGYALVIGINEYRGSISSLQSAAKDASAISSALKDDHEYKVTCLLDEDASAEVIYDQIENVLPSSMDSDSAFLLYFAGHGVARGDGSEGPKGFLLPQDATTGEQESWVSMERVRKALEAYPNRHLLIVLDCCFAGSFRWTSTRDVFIEEPLYESQYQRYLQGQAWQVLTSASHDEKAMDVAPGRDNTRDTTSIDGHSPFAKAILSGLAGNADSATGSHDPDGVITATELYQYAFSELVPADAKSHQTPGIWPLKPDNEGQYIFRNPMQPKSTIPDPPLDDANNPWLGLSAYSSENSSLFFGRKRVIDEILELIESSEIRKFIPIIGASGTGKSSVVRAGIIPALVEEGWLVTQSARLNATPIQSLETALQELEAANVDTRKMLFVDQFEELFTLCTVSELRTEYLTRIRQLIDDSSHLHIMITVRSDFAPRLANSNALGDLWNSHRYLVPAFSSEEFRSCIEGPAQVRALYLENEDLIGDLIDEVTAMPGALPMLSFALSEMYRSAQQRRRDSGSNDRALLREDYEAIGGVIGSIQGRATALYKEADPDTRATIQRVFLRMTSQDGARLARRRIELEELNYTDECEQARVDKVLETYIGARLLVASENTIEPAHDTLILAWNLLLDWLSESGSQSLKRALWRSASDWRESKEDKGLTWNDDPRLPLALAETSELNAREQNFVKASEKQRTSIRNRTLTIAIIVILALITVGLLAYDSYLQAGIKTQEAALSGQEAEISKREAENQKQRAELEAQKAETQAQQAQLARETRDKIYLDILEQGDFFKLEDVLPSNAQGGVLEVNDDWRKLVVIEDQGTFVAGRVLGEGRVLAGGHESLLTFVDKNGGFLFLDLALSWLVADGNKTIYFTSGHQETLPVYDRVRYRAMRAALSGAGYDLISESVSFEQAIEQASVVIVGNAWKDFSQREISLIQKHVLSGKGLFVAGLGWSWVSYGPHQLKNDPRAIKVYPINKLMKDLGVRWTVDPIFVN